MNRSFSRRGWIVLTAVLLSSAFLAVYVASMPARVPGQEPLTDIQSIETLRTQFNEDVGRTRLIILASPT
jgi:hypothetical protein